MPYLSNIANCCVGTAGCSVLNRQLTANVRSNDGPTVEEIRGAMRRIADSSSFRRSPQLVAFLRFIVESSLGGKAERIKSYTIAVEAFGRDETFDPQVDPIVR